MPDSKDRIWPEVGSFVTISGKLLLNKHESNGYFYAAYNGTTKKRLKLRVVKERMTLTYDLNGNGRYELFPFQLGDGRYTITLFQNVAGKLYYSIGSFTLHVKLTDADIPFLIPNQYVPYTEDSNAVRIADRLCNGMSAEKAYKTICDFVTRSFAFDFIKAVTVKPGALPDIDGVFSKNMGVCQDLAALSVAMFRSQGIPSKLVIGYADKQYHAWTVSKVGEREYLFDPTEKISAISKVKKYTAERFY